MCETTSSSNDSSVGVGTVQATGAADIMSAP